MSYENQFPLPDYDGGPRDRLREQAQETQRREAMQRLDDLADLRCHLRLFVANESEVAQAAEYLYQLGYRRGD